MDHWPPAWDAETERASGRVLRWQAAIALVVWTLALFVSLAWNLRQNERQMMAHAHKEALANFNKDQAFRFWATKHGGVYVPATAETPPSPYLAHVPERDVVTPSGQVLTLLNPNYMVREMQQEYRERYGIRGHITGLRLLRPENAPDAWERRALEAFGRGTGEVVDLAVLDGEPFLRLMRPMVMEEGCVKCHGHLGYSVGDVRGGVGIAVPMRPYLEARRHADTGLFAGHGVIWLLGVGLIGVGASQLRRRLSETLRAEADLRRLNLELEARVAQRTAALAEKEERLRMMVSTAADGILTADDSGTIESANAAAAKIFGYAPEELAGQPIGLLVPPPHDQRHQSYIEADLWSGNSRVIGIGREVQGRRKDGTVFPLHLAVGAARLENRTLFTAVLRDLTAQKRAEAELMAAKDLAEAVRRQAEAANRAKSRFLASMSHELRTPINAVLGFAQLLDRGIAGEVSDKQREYVRIILTAGNHLLQLIGDVLDLAKIEADKVDLSLEAVRPAEVVAECLGLMAPLAQKMGVAIDDRVTGCPEAAEVRADYVRLKQVLVNLVSNGIKYNRPGGRVVISCQAGAPGMQRLVVEDNGKGIAGERLSGLFQPFNRLGAEAGTVEGTGIGLTITKRLVELMAGRIEAESELGAGSRFTIELPVASAEEPRRGSRSPVAASPSALTIIGGRHTILYVEDNPLNVELVREMLGLFANITFLSAPTAEAGIETARIDRPDLILMDINLPGIDGFEALRRLRMHEETRLIPAIALSATAMPQDIRRGLEAGFSSYLVKPLDVARTIEAINVALDSPDPARRP